MVNINHNIDAVKIESSIQFINKYILKRVVSNHLYPYQKREKEDPTNKSLLAQLFDTLKNLGPIQGAVLT